MAPIKFEENIKDKFEKRAIQPSAELWSKLENRLDNQDKKQNKKRYWWLGIAASFVGAILLTTQLFNNNVTEHQSTEIVNTDSEIITDELHSQDDVFIEDLNISETQLTTVSSKDRSVINENKVTDKTNNNVLVKEEEVVNNIGNSTKEYAQIKAKKTVENVKLDQTVLNELPFEQLKLNEVVAQIKTMSEDGKLVTEEDIDALLLQAEKEIITNNIYNESTKVVDAKALLQDVEADLDQSFRNKVFKTLKSSYYTVKTAVADRNN